MIEKRVSNLEAATAQQYKVPSDHPIVLAFEKSLQLYNQECQQAKGTKVKVGPASNSQIYARIEAIVNNPDKLTPNETKELEGQVQEVTTNPNTRTLEREKFGEIRKCQQVKVTKNVAYLQIRIEEKHQEVKKIVKNELEEAGKVTPGGPPPPPVPKALRDALVAKRLWGEGSKEREQGKGTSEEE